MWCVAILLRVCHVCLFFLTTTVGFRLEANTDGEKLIPKIDGSFLVAASKGSDYAGFTPTGLPCMYYQTTGEKVIMIIDIDEAMEWYRKSKSESADIAIQDCLSVEGCCICILFWRSMTNEGILNTVFYQCRNILSRHMLHCRQQALNLLNNDCRMSLTSSSRMMMYQMFLSWVHLEVEYWWLVMSCTSPRVRWSLRRPSSATTWVSDLFLRLWTLARHRCLGSSETVTLGSLLLFFEASFYIWWIHCTCTFLHFTH